MPTGNLSAAVPNPAVQDAGEQPAGKKYRYWQTNWSFESIDMGKLLGRLRQVGIEVPIDAEGQVTVNFSVSVPLNGLTTGRAYRFSGTLSSPRLRLEELALDTLSTNIDYEDGKLTFSDLSMQWVDASVAATAAGSNSKGDLKGTGEFQLVPLGQFKASLEAQSLAVAPAYQLFSTVSTSTNNKEQIRFGGSVSGKVDVTGSLKDFDKIATWSVAANLLGRDLTIGDGLPLVIATGPLSINNSRIDAPDIRLGSPVDPDIKLAGSLDATIGGATPFKFRLRGDDVPLANIASLISFAKSELLKGKLDLDLTGSGTLTPSAGQPSWLIEGRLASPQLFVSGVDLGTLAHRLRFDAEQFSLTRLSTDPNQRLTIEQISAEYQISAPQVVLDQLTAKVFGGEVRGTASIAREQSGTHNVDLNWSDIQPTLDTGAFLPASLTLSLKTSGRIQWQVPADSLTQLATHQGTAELTIDPIELGETTLGDLRATLTADRSNLILRGNGNLLGGRIEVDTTAPLTAESTIQDLIGGQLTASARINDLKLERLQLVLMDNGRMYQGQVNGELSYSAADGALTATLVGNHLGVDGTELVRRIDGRLTYSNRVLEISALRGELAGGRFEAVGRIAVDPSANTSLRGRLDTRITSVDLSKALQLVSPSAADWAAGSVSGDITINLGREIVAGGAIVVRDNELYRIAVGDTHGTLTASLNPTAKRWKVHLAAIEGRLGRGRIVGDLVLRSSTIRPGGFDLQSDWRAKRLDFNALFNDLGSSTGFAQGQLDGQLVLEGQGIQSLNDLQGRYDAKLGGTEARAVPGLLSVQSYLGVFSLAGTRFDAGRVRGTIGGGVLRVNEFWLTSDRVKVWADGRVRLDGAQLDIDAVVQTGDFTTQNLALLTLAETAAIPTGVPIAAIIELNRLVSNRTLYLELVGPVARPRVRVRPLETFRDNAKQIIIREAASTALPFSALTDR